MSHGTQPYASTFHLPRLSGSLRAKRQLDIRRHACHPVTCRAVPHLALRVEPFRAGTCLPSLPALAIQKSKQLHRTIRYRLLASFPSSPSSRMDFDLASRAGNRQAEIIPKFLEFLSFHRLP